jgi:hypothetical protein
MNWLKKIISGIFSPSNQTLPKIDVLEVYDKLCFGLGKNWVSLYEITFRDGSKSFFCTLKTRSRHISMGELDKTSKGKLGQELESRFIGPIGNGGFLPTIEYTDSGLVALFLGIQFVSPPKNYTYKLLFPEPQKTVFKLWDKIDECFADAFVAARILLNEGKKAMVLVCYGLEYSHSVGMIQKEDSTLIVDFNSPNGRTTKSNRLDQVAQEAIPATILSRAALVSL